MLAAISFERATSALAEPEGLGTWRADFDASASFMADAELRVPEGEALAERCRRYRFPEPAVETLVAHRDEWDDERVRRLGAHAQWLAWERYAPGNDGQAGWPAPPRECPLLYAYAAIGLAPRTEGAHAALGIQPDVTAATLWDIGKQVVLHRRIHGEVGMPKGWWIVHHLALHLFRLGRLQFQRDLSRPAYAPLPVGERFLGVHIPEDGPLAPQACEESFAAARAFFERHYPEDRPRGFVCASWLLDPTLAELLPDDSNIVRFQRRFELVASAKSYSSVFEFLFDRPDLDRAQEPDLEALPQETALERAVVAHYRGGGRIGAGIGVISS